MERERPLKDRARKVAARLRTEIPGDIQRDFWCVPLLEKLIERIEELEKRQ